MLRLHDARMLHCRVVYAAWLGEDAQRDARASAVADDDCYYFAREWNEHETSYQCLTCIWRDGGYELEEVRNMLGEGL